MFLYFWIVSLLEWEVNVDEKPKLDHAQKEGYDGFIIDKKRRHT